MRASLRYCATASIALTLFWAHGSRAADGPVLAPASFHVAAPGSVFHFRRDNENRDVVVGKPDGYFVNTTVNGTPREAFLLSGVQPEHLTADELQDAVAIWPLAVGKTVKYHRQLSGGRSASWVDELAVVRTETLIINGAPIDTYVVRWNSSGELRNRWDATMTTWFAPSLGWVVKISYSQSNGLRWDEQLLGYDLAH